MTYSMSHVIRWLRAGIMIAVYCAVPLVSHASYTMYGQTFNTFDELVAYAREYTRVYNELHGISNSTSTVTPATAPARNSITTTPTVRPAAVSAVNTVVKTYAAESVTSDSARLTGTIRMSHGDTYKVWFEYGPYASRFTNQTVYELLTYEESVRPFDRELRDLPRNTLFYYRAVAENKSGVRVYGTTYTFKTGIDPWKDSTAPYVRTSWGTGDLDDDRALLQGSLTFRKNAFMRVWFEYGTDETALSEHTPHVYMTPSMGDAYEYMVTDLDPNTTYYYRIVSDGPNNERSYGSATRFTTYTHWSNQAPSVDAFRVTSVGPYSAVVSGGIDMNDYRNGTAFLVYGENEDDIRSVSREHRYRDIDVDGDYIQKVLLDRDLDEYRTFTETLRYLDLDTTIYAAFGLEYKNDDGDYVILMSNVLSFTTLDH